MKRETPTLSGYSEDHQRRALDRIIDDLGDVPEPKRLIADDEAEAMAAIHDGIDAFSH